MRSRMRAFDGILLAAGTPEADAGVLGGIAARDSPGPTANKPINLSTPAATVAGWKSAEAKTLKAFEGFLKTAGRVVGVILADLVKYIVPIVQVAAVMDPAAASAITAFTTSLELVQAAVLSAEQRWGSEGSAANSQKLQDVLLTVEQPIALLFAQAGLQVDTAYVLNLINGVVAILNAQPACMLRLSN